MKGDTDESSLVFPGEGLLINPDTCLIYYVNMHSGGTTIILECRQCKPPIVFQYLFAHAISMSQKLNLGQ